MIAKILAVFQFEWRRALTLPRMAWWAALTLFPIGFVSLFWLSPLPELPREEWVVILFALSPMLIVMLGTFLWAAPVISAELERRSWIYLAVRPHGRMAVVLGKYLAALTWVIPAAVIGMSVALLIADPSGKRELWLALAGLICLSCPAYAALYMLIGIAFPKRAMLIAVAYTLVMELVISFLPAMINKLSIQYRLRALLIEWTGVMDPVERTKLLDYFGSEPAWLHVLTLLLATAVLVTMSVLLIRVREFSQSDESDQ